MIKNTSHRPFPLPEGPWMMTQTWNHVLFAHWAVDPEAIRGQIPAALELETFNGKAWIGILPFLLTNMRPRFLPPFPFISRFPELNVRTYVAYKGVPGIYFFSLDAASRLAVAGARSMFHLPYFYAGMRFAQHKDRFQLTSRRKRSQAEFYAEYQPVSELSQLIKERLNTGLLKGTVCTPRIKTSSIMKISTIQSGSCSRLKLIFFRVRSQAQTISHSQTPRPFFIMQKGSTSYFGR